jgi:electron transport complex protein RnfG
MKESLRLVLVLTVICLLAGVVLAAVYDLTRGPIEQAKREEKLAALEQVLPSYDNDPYENKCVISADGVEFVFFVARKDSKFVGAAFEASAPGYGDAVTVMVGINAANEIHAVVVLEAPKETPGLGANVKESKFLDQFSGNSAKQRDWCSVRQDGGEIDAVTSATISSRAVTAAVTSGLEIFLQHRDEIVRTMNTKKVVSE